MSCSQIREDIQVFINSVLFSHRSPLEAQNISHSAITSEPVTIDDDITAKQEEQNCESLLGELKAEEKGVKIGQVKERNKSKDYLKNMYNNSLKYIVKRYISRAYATRVHRIHRKLGIADSTGAKAYYRVRQEETIGLTNLCDLLNYNSGQEEQRRFKKAFQIFYLWFMRTRYPSHILQTGKLQHADVYWKAKNVLIYLPQLKVGKDKMQKPRLMSMETNSQFNLC